MARVFTLLTFFFFIYQALNAEYDYQTSIRHSATKNMLRDDGQTNHHDQASTMLRSASRRNLKKNGSFKASLANAAEDPITLYLARRHRLDDRESPITCDICETIISQIQKMVKESKTDAEIAMSVIKLCILFKIEDERVCSMIVPMFKEEVLYVIENLVLSPEEACGILLGDACATPYYPGQMWNVTFPDKPKPAPKPPTPPQPAAPKIRVLHFTDIHMDFQYQEGSRVDCKEPVCCRQNDDNITNYNDSTKAGKYGMYGFCDAPQALLVNMFRYLSTIQDQFDYVIFTGDIPAHDVWNQSKATQIEHIVALDRLFIKYLPQKPVYYCIGNHESAPVNSFPPPGMSNHEPTWLYATLAGIWGRWLPQLALATVLQCGGYSVSPYLGFRIISVNNNYCNTGNWWLLLNETDPCNVLQWLIQELQNAEDEGEKVHLLMHIPPGARSCLKAWSYNFYKIVNRYENTIVNQFYGHSHYDWFQMFYDDITFQRPVSFGFVLSSITPDSNGDPIFRIYTIDGNYHNSSWAVLDYQNIYLDLTEANVHYDAPWQYQYSPREAFNMSSLYTADWEDLLQRMEKDDSLFQLFYKFNQNMNPAGICDDQCKKDLLCQLKEGRSYDPDLCTIHK